MTGRHGGNRNDTSFIYGISRHPMYPVWQTMKARCSREYHHEFLRYGGRGIKVCDEWMSDFMNFYNDMVSGYRRGLTLERKDNDGNYSKDNCIWVDHKTQARNRRNNRFIDTPAGKMLLCEAEELSGVSREVLKYRSKRGWPVSMMFDPPDSGRVVVGR